MSRSISQREPIASRATRADARGATLPLGPALIAAGRIGEEFAMKACVDYVLKVKLQFYSRVN